MECGTKRCARCIQRRPIKDIVVRPEDTGKICIFPMYDTCWHEDGEPYLDWETATEWLECAKEWYENNTDVYGTHRLNHTRWLWRKLTNGPYTQKLYDKIMSIEW